MDTEYWKKQCKKITDDAIMLKKRIKELEESLDTHVNGAIRTRISQLTIDKERINNAHKKVMKEINHHLKTCQEALNQSDKE